MLSSQLLIISTQADCVTCVKLHAQCSYVGPHSLYRWRLSYCRYTTANQPQAIESFHMSKHNCVPDSGDLGQMPCIEAHKLTALHTAQLAASFSNTGSSRTHLSTNGIASWCNCRDNWDSMNWACTFTVTSLLCQSGVDSFHGWSGELGVRVWETGPWGPQLWIPQSLPAYQEPHHPFC